MNESFFFASTRAQTIRGRSAVVVARSFSRFEMFLEYAPELHFSILYHIFLCCTGRWIPRHVIRASSKFCLVWLRPRGHGAWQKRLVLDEARALIFSVPLSRWGNLHDKSWKIIWWLERCHGGNVWMCFNLQLFIFDVYCHIILMLASQMRKVPWKHT